MRYTLIELGWLRRRRSNSLTSHTKAKIVLEQTFSAVFNQFWTLFQAFLAGIQLRHILFGNCTKINIYLHGFLCFSAIFRAAADFVFIFIRDSHFSCRLRAAVY